MINCFDSDVAQNVGVIAAVIYKNIQYWCEHNRANRKNEHDGYFWTFNSVEAFCEMFSYLTKNQIILALKKLEESGYIKSGNYNKSAYDRTKWYTDIKGGFGELSDEPIFDKTEMEMQENKNGIIENEKPIPNNNTNNNQITTDKKNTKKKFDAIAFLDTVEFIRVNPDLKAAFISFLEMRESIKHPVKTEDGMKRLINEAYKCGNGDPTQMVACINKSIIGSYRGIFPVHQDFTKNAPSPKKAQNGPKSAMDILDEMMAEEMAKEANNA